MCYFRRPERHKMSSAHNRSVGNQLEITNQMTMSRRLQCWRMHLDCCLASHLLSISCLFFAFKFNKNLLFTNAPLWKIILNENITRSLGFSCHNTNEISSNKFQVIPLNSFSQPFFA